jgi:hypothetical protein
MKEILWLLFSPPFPGTVTDADNRLINKIMVQVKGTSRRALNNNIGKFSINASGNDVLFFSSGDDYSNSGDFKYRLFKALAMEA